MDADPSLIINLKKTYMQDYNFQQESSGFEELNRENEQHRLKDPEVFNEKRKKLTS